MKHFKFKKKEHTKQFYILENRTHLPKPKITLMFFRNVIKIKRYAEINIDF